jgi:hypothetical protein
MSSHRHRALLGAQLVVIVAAVALLVSLTLGVRPAFASHEGDATATHHLPAGTATLDGSLDASYQQVAVLTHKGEPDGEVVADVYMVYDEDAARLFVFIQMRSPYTIHDSDHKIILHNAAGRIFNSEGRTWNGIFGPGHTSVEFSAAYDCVVAPGEPVGLRLNYTRPDNEKTEARLPGQTDSPLLVMPIACPEEEVLPEERGQITVIKDAADDPAASFDFAFNATAFALTHEQSATFDDLAADTYVVAEAVGDLATGWSLAAIECEATGASQAAIDLTGGTATVSLAAGDAVECTFTNVFDVEEAVLPGVGLPDTAVGAPDGRALPVVLGLVLLASLAGAATVNLAAVRRRIR